MYFKELISVTRGLKILIVSLAVTLALNLIVHQGAKTVDDLALVKVNVGSGPSVATATATTADDRVPLSLLFAIAGVIATIFAGAYGSSLAGENRGHLELAWTKPASRDRYALVTMGIDLIAIEAAFGITLAFAVAVLAGTGHLQQIVADPHLGINLVRFMLLPIAFYGLWQALTASLRSQAALVIGCSVLVCAFLLGLQAMLHGEPWHTLIRSVNFLNPLVYGTYQSGATTIQYPFATWEFNLAALALIGAAGAVLALAQWRRVEA